MKNKGCNRSLSECRETGADADSVSVAPTTGCRVTVTGLGYVGLPTAVLLAQAGYRVKGVDRNPEVLERIRAGRVLRKEERLPTLLREVLEDGRLALSAEPMEADVYLIAVPTPLRPDGSADVSCVFAALDALIPFFKPNDLLLLESTVPVGTTERAAGSVFDRRPELKGKLRVAYCPERVLPGRMYVEMRRNPRVVGGLDDASTAEALRFYASFVTGSLSGTTAQHAEFCKLFENTARLIELAAANLLWLLCEKADLNPDEAARLVGLHPRVGLLRPGCGVGGHCMPVDPCFLVQAFPEETGLIRAALAVNERKTERCIELIRNAVSQEREKKGRKPVVALMGLSYKPDTDDLRKSAALRIAQEAGRWKEAECLFAEPNREEVPGLPLTDYREAFRRADIAVFLVAHAEFSGLPLPAGKRVLDFR